MNNLNTLALYFKHVTMKHLAVFFFLVFVARILHAQTVEDPYAGMDGARISFEQDYADLGDITQGEKATHAFAFSNTGNEPLVINNVITTCGCTAPQWPEKPVAPGAQGQIKVVFDSAGKIGRQNKIITVQSNALGQYHRVKIAAMVLPPGDGK